MRAVKHKVTDMTADELKGVVQEAIVEDMEVWRRMRYDKTGLKMTQDLYADQ
jgi:hypothetical protein